MKTILSLVLVAAVWNFASTAAVGESVTQCYNKYGSFNIGKTAVKEYCGERTCKEDGTFSIESCPMLSVVPGAVIIPEDLSKSFPHCCETAIMREGAKQCQHPVYGTFYVGKTALTKQCGVAICREDQRLEINSCLSVIGPGYILEDGDLSKSYPECCGKVVKAPRA